MLIIPSPQKLSTTPFTSWQLPSVGTQPPGVGFTNPATQPPVAAAFPFTSAAANNPVEHVAGMVNGLHSVTTPNALIAFIYPVWGGLRLAQLVAVLANGLHNGLYVVESMSYIYWPAGQVSVITCGAQVILGVAVGSYFLKT
jgi:hypothetical protein